MKRFILFILCSAMFSFAFCSCNNTQNQPKNPTENVTVKSHSINESLNKDYYDVNKKAEEIFNIINEKNAEKLKALFSADVKNTVSDLDEQIQILFDYIDEPIIDYDEGLDGGGSHTDKGEVLEKDLSTTIVFYTESKDYYLWMTYNLADENDDKVGLDYICFADKEEEDRRLNEMIDNPDYERPEDDGYHQGVICYSSDGSILKN